MDEFTAAEAAKWLGVSREAVDLAARQGRLPALGGDGPRRFSRAALEAYHQVRVQERIAALARARETPVSAARKVRRGLSESGTGLPSSVDAKLSAMPAAWRALFNLAELSAAGVPDGGGCRWCKALEFGRFLGARPVEYAPAFVELFGGQPCGVCRPRLLRPYWAALEARVHPAGGGSSVAAVAPTAAERARAAEYVQRRPVTPSGKPVADDDGRALVARRRREVQARLTAAKRAGDQRYAIHLRQTLTALTADAARVDGRPVSAKPGRLACGHLVSAGCACARRASKRGQR